MRQRGRFTALLGALSLSAAACGGGFAGDVAVSGETKPAVPQRNLVEVLAADPDARFTTLIGLVKAHDQTEGVKVKVADVLAGPGPLTLFAPVNDAFDDDLDALGVELVEKEDGTTEFKVTKSPDKLFKVLAAHVVAKDVTFKTPSYVTDGMVDGRISFEDYGLVIVESDTTVTTVGDDEIEIEADGTVTFDGDDVEVIEADVQAPNGFIHIIGTVLG